MTEFDEFLINKALYGSIIQGNKGTISTLTTINHPRDLVQEIKRGINHDTTSFINLKEFMQWYNRNHTTIWEERAEMIPVALFDEKLEYIIAVFEKVFQNHKGKDLIRLYMKA